MPRSFLGTTPSLAWGGIHSTVCQCPYSFVSLEAGALGDIGLKGSSSSSWNACPHHTSFTLRRAQFSLKGTKRATLRSPGMFACMPIVWCCGYLACPMQREVRIQYLSRACPLVTQPQSRHFFRGAILGQSTKENVRKPGKCTSASSSGVVAALGSSLVPRRLTVFAGVSSSASMTWRPLRCHISTCSAHAGAATQLYDSVDSCSQNALKSFNCMYIHSPPLAQSMWHSCSNSASSRRKQR